MKIFRCLIAYNIFRVFVAVSHPTTNNLKICKDCKYYMADVKRCRAFSTTDIITGKKTYQDAYDVRKNETICGVDGIHFEKNRFKLITVPYYFVKSESYIIPIMCIFMAQIFIAILSIHK